MQISISLSPKQHLPQVTWLDARRRTAHLARTAQKILLITPTSKVHKRFSFEEPVAELRHVACGLGFFTRLNQHSTAHVFTRGLWVRFCGGGFFFSSSSRLCALQVAERLVVLTRLWILVAGERKTRFRRAGTDSCFFLCGPGLERKVWWSEKREKYK